MWFPHRQALISVQPKSREWASADRWCPALQTLTAWSQGPIPVCAVHGDHWAQPGLSSVGCASETLSRAVSWVNHMTPFSQVALACDAYGQCLKTVVQILCSFLVVSGRRANLIPVTSSWSQEDILVHWFFSHFPVPSLSSISTCYSLWVLAYLQISLFHHNREWYLGCIISWVAVLFFWHSVMFTSIPVIPSVAEKK